MLYSHNLLKRYLSLDTDPQTIADQLILKTCEVEEIHTRVVPEKVVIGKVVEKVKHPEADKLSVCQVDCGDKWSYQICCGATNVDTDMYVAVALPWCTLPAINLTIEPRSLRGQKSNGMICSKEELWIPEDLEEKWIWILQKTDTSWWTEQTDFDDITDTDLGTALAEKYPWLENWMMDIENKTITHRPDLFGHFGLGIELQAIFDKNIHFDGIKKHRETMQAHYIFQTLDNAKKAAIGIDMQTKKVHSYALLELHNVQWKQSDLYQRLLLLDQGLQPKSNWVDFSNVFMYLTGQPIHFFDAKKVAWDVIVRQAKQGETCIDLFGDEHVLTEEDIVIADSTKILALGGIVGSNVSGIDASTTDIIVEIANFDEVQVRKTWTRLWLRTDAEIRFEKWINPLYTLYCVLFFLDELAYFKKSIWSYEIGWVVWEVNNTDTTLVTKHISIDYDHVSRLLFGVDTQDMLSVSDIQDSLEKLWFTVQDNTIQVPLWRWPWDIHGAHDVYEEIARMYGFDIIAPIPYRDVSKYVPFEQAIQWQRDIEDLFLQHAFTQVETYPWLHKQWFSYTKTHDLFRLANPLDPEQSHLRPDMWMSMCEIVAKNAPFFETCKLFDLWKTRQQSREHHEHDVFSFALWTKDIDTWQDEPLLEAKTMIDRVLKTLHARGRLQYDLTKHTYFHPKQQARIIFNTQDIWSLQTIHPSLLEKHKLPPTWRLVIVEIDLTLLNNIVKPKKPWSMASYRTLQDQIVTRDLNFVLDQATPYGSLVERVQNIRDIEQVDIFDLYQGEYLPSWKKSIALRIHITWENMKTEDINAIMDKAIAQVEKIGGNLRW